MNFMTNLLIKFIFQMPLVFVLLSSVETTFNIPGIYAIIVGFILLVLYDIGDYITKEDLK